MFDNWKTFILVILAMSLSFIALMQGLVDAALFEKVMFAALGAYTARTVTDKITKK